MRSKDKLPPFSQVVHITLERLVQRKAQIVLLLIVAFLLSAVYSRWDGWTRATATMSLNYAEASRGLNPNSTQFSIYDIRSSEVIGRMLDYAGLTGKADAAEITNCITVEEQRTRGGHRIRITSSAPPTASRSTTRKGCLEKEVPRICCISSVRPIRNFSWRIMGTTRAFCTRR